jgi:hypothetical protein
MTLVSPAYLCDVHAEESPVAQGQSAAELRDHGELPRLMHEDTGALAGVGARHALITLQVQQHIQTPGTPWLKERDAFRLLPDGHLTGAGCNQHNHPRPPKRADNNNDMCTGK